MRNIWRLLGLVPHYKTRLIKVLLSNGFLGLAALVTPYLYRNILNLIVTAVTTGATSNLTSKLLWGIGLVLGISILGVIFDYIAERLSDLLFIDVIWDIRRVVFQHLAMLSVDYYEQTRAGEVLERTNTGTADFAQWVYGISDGLLGTIISILFIVVLLWFRLPIVGLVITVTLPLSFYFAVVKVLKTKPIRREWHKQAEGASAEMAETLTHISTIKSFSKEKYKFDRYVKTLVGYRDLRVKQSQIEWSTNFYRGLLNTVTVSLVIGIVAFGVVHGRYTAGDILLVSLYLQQLLGSISPLSRLIINTGNIETSAERITQLLDVRPTLVDAPDAEALDKISTIEFKSVSFAYPGKSEDVLRGISFILKSGESLALVGPSGVGKTTITKLLLRFYAPASGQIFINDQPVEKFTQESIRQHIGTVMQDVALFNETLEENLRFVAPEASDQQIKDAAKIAHVDAFVEKLPNGYQTMVGERGIRLSGGEKQRVAIARAILRNPELIILDEATSALDSQSEKFVQEGLQSLLKDRTAVIIAHRLSTVMKADKILVLQDGQVIEQGTHQELLKNKALYAKLFALQSQSSAKSVL